jgi:hypothetical protein
MSKKWGIVALSLLLVLLLVAGGWWYVRRPERVVNLALSRADAATSHAFTSTLALANNEQTKNLLGEEGKLELNLDGVYQQGPANATELESKVFASIVTESVTVQLTGEVRLIGGQAYFLINKAPAALPFLQPFKGRWIQLPPRTTDTQPLLSSGSGDPILSEINFLGKEEVADQPTNHYQAQASRTAVIHFLNKLASLLGSSLSSEQLAELNTTTQDISDLPLDLWITPYSLELRRLATALSAPSGNIIDLTLTLTKPNQPVSVTTPEGAVPIEEVLRGN